MINKTFKMEGLTCEGCTCGHCGKPIIIFLSCLKGVITTDPHYESHTIQIMFDETLLSPESLVTHIKDRGYAIEAM